MEPRKSVRKVDNSSRGTKNNIDRISALPDSILGDILSLIPTKNAIATSILSKRWKFVWRMVYNLDFCHDDDKILGVEQVEDENNKFVRYVNHVLLHRDVGLLKLNKFQLIWKYNPIESHFTSWIKTAVTRHVRELSLHLCSHEGAFDIPVSVFSCDSLRSLHLTGWRVYLSAPTAFCLPKLEILHLERVAFGSDEDFENIINGCPMLNYLHLRNDYWEDDDFNFIISSTSLKRLFLSLWVYKSLKLDASSLEHLTLDNGRSENILLKDLGSLVEAVFDIYFDHEVDSSPSGLYNYIVDAVCALRSARTLTLSDRVMMALSCATVKLSTDFKRLVELQTRVSCNHWSSLLDLIQSSDNLEFLKIYKERACPSDDENDEDHDHSSWTTPIEVPRCLSTSLKKIVLDGYFGFEDEREMLRYMLNNGSALEFVNISFDAYMKGSMFEQVEDICQFQRMSAVCEIKFIGWTSREKEKVCCTVPPGTFPNISFVSMESSD